MHRKFFDSLPSRLRELYEESGESQEVLANKLNLRRQSVNAWTVGKSKPDIDQLVEIANHFNVSIDWLLGMPNAPKELNADKAQIMKTTGLSEKAAENLLSVEKEGSSFASNGLISLNCFPHAMNNLYEAFLLAVGSKNENTEFSFIPVDEEEAPDLSKHAPKATVKDLIAIYSSIAFKLLENEFRSDLFRLIELKQNEPLPLHFNEEDQ